MAEIVYRPAGLDDAAEIHALLLRLAPEIPLLVDTLAREEALYALVRNCARSGESWVACAEAEGIVGVVLVEPNQRGRHYAEHEVLDLRHAGVAPEQSDRGSILGTLIGKVLARLQPVSARVGAQNRSGLAERLREAGFVAAGAPGGEQLWRWEPGAGGR